MNETDKRVVLKRWSPMIMFAVIAFLSSAGFRDYGLSTDEPLQRNHLLTQARHIFMTAGLLRYAPRAVRQAADLPTYAHRYYGVAGQYPLLLLEYFPVKLNPRQPLFWEIRHLYSRTIFLLSALAFFFIITRVSRSAWVRFMGMTLYLTHPRIHANSFYNIKDLLFLSFMVFSLLCLVRFVEKPTWQRTLWLGMVSAVAINIRMMGIVIPCFVMLWLLVAMRRQPRRMIQLASTYAAVLAVTLFLVWPTLWMNPLRLFAEAFSHFSNYSVWNGRILFAGQLIRANQPTWYYAPVWIGITSPFFHLFIWGVGIVIMAVDAGRSVIHREARRPIAAHFSLVVVLGSYAAILFFHSTLYGDWRHLYYLFPMLCVLAAVALEHIRARSIKAFAALSLIMALSLAQTVLWMVRNHPHQYVYFNPLAGRDWGQKWGRDNWNLSCKHMLRALLEKDRTPRPLLIFQTKKQDGLFRAKWMLTQDEQAGIQFVGSLKEADYAIGNYRNVRGDYPANRFRPLKAYMHIVVDGNKIMTVFKRARQK